ncbi:MAG: 2-phosphosulfolactate phosphatase [Calditrichaceae bacterium]
MNIEVAYSFDDLNSLSQKTVIVIDVLRASTSIVAAFANGCRSIYPVESLEEAKSMHIKSPDALLCGERDGLRPDFFHLGNSPFEYTSEKVSGKDLILTTTNGTRALTIAKKANIVFVGSFVNLNAVLDKSLSAGQDIVMLPAGRAGGFSWEDALCAGMMSYELNRRVCNLSMSDGARWSYYAFLGLFGQNPAPTAEQLTVLLGNTIHGVHLKKIGFAKDLQFCADINRFKLIPTLSGDELIMSV